VNEVTEEESEESEGSEWNENYLIKFDRMEEEENGVDEEEEREYF
jgi:hypothetical protein